MINNSSQGMDASLIKDVLGLDTRSFLFQYKDVGGIKREKVGSHYVYLSSDQQRFSQQLSNKKQCLELLAQAPLEGTAAISVLVETIKHPDFTFEQLSKHLSIQGIKLKPVDIQDFFIFHGIEKKNAGFQAVNLLRELTGDKVNSLILANAFAEISQQEVMKKMQDTKKDETKIPGNVLMLIRQKETMQKLLYLIAS